MTIKRWVTARVVAASLLSLPVALADLPSAWAQVTNPAASSGSISTATVPDVQIVVSPDSTGQWVVAAVYPIKVERKKAESRARQMLTLGKWKGNGLLFENKALERIENPKGMAPPPVMSSVTLSTPANLVNYADGTVSLEPFIRAYRDLNRLHILFLVPGTFTYRGPRTFRDSDLEMNYASGGSALTYVVQVKNHALGPLRLPRLEPAVATVAPSPAAGGETLGTASRFGIVIALALAAAGLAFFGVQRWNSR
ncbi:MAG: hypothetical protein H7Z41_19815 [Cytophagales bacterium]|nr:hypothetical protein [Armatimonadota bacterium]